MISENKINEAIKRLVKAYAPLKIYLFGSYARGNPSEDSDLDFFVVIEESSEFRPKRAIKGHMALIGLDVPKDIVVYTKKEFETKVNDPLTFSYKIKEEGKLVYEA